MAYQIGQTIFSALDDMVFEQFFDLPDLVVILTYADKNTR